MAARRIPGKEPVPAQRTVAGYEVAGIEQLAFSPKKVAALLDLTDEYVYALIESGELPAVPLGKYWRVSGTAVRDLLSRHDNTA
jgi:excisionase family DNA binding protein